MEFVKSTAILTEHLGYAPIAVIDDVINAVNDILYKCTAAMETFLAERYGHDESIPEDEIEVGTAKLETLLESVVDRCFDKFELYVLRNLLVVPPDLINGGWMRLEHHLNVDFDNNNTNLSDRIVELKRELYQQKHLNFLLKTRSKRAAKLLSVLDGYKQALASLQQQQPKALNDVAPINETVQYLSSQVVQMIAKIEQLYNSKDAQLSLKPSQHMASRDEYVSTFTRRAVELHSGEFEDDDKENARNGERVRDAEHAQKLAETFQIH